MRQGHDSRIESPEAARPELEVPAETVRAPVVGSRRRCPVRQEVDLTGRQTACSASCRRERTRPAGTGRPRGCSRRSAEAEIRAAEHEARGKDGLRTARRRLGSAALMRSSPAPLQASPSASSARPRGLSGLGTNTWNQPVSPETLASNGLTAHGAYGLDDMVVVGRAQDFQTCRRR